MQKWKEIIQGSLIVIFNKFFACLFYILTASPLLNYSITSLYNSAKRAEQKEYFFFHFSLLIAYTPTCLVLQKKLEWHRVMIHHHLFMQNSHRTFESQKGRERVLILLIVCICVYGCILHALLLSMTSGNIRRTSLDN